jgi:DNA-binding NarL/FixJ family response regulator
MALEAMYTVTVVPAERVRSMASATGVDGLPGAARAGAARLTRVMVADPHPATRAGLAAMLGRDERMRVVGEIATVEELEADVVRLAPDVVLVDGRLAGARPAELVLRLGRLAPAARVLLVVPAVTGWEPELLDAGAGGTVDRDADATALADAVRAVAGGATVVAAARRGALSPRELEILTLIAGGQTNTEIGEALFLATKTVERQVATVAGKLGARNRAHAAAIAVAQRLVELPGHVEGFPR